MWSLPEVASLVAGSSLCAEAGEFAGGVCSSLTLEAADLRPLWLGYRKKFRGVSFTQFSTLKQSECLWENAERWFAIIEAVVPIKALFGWIQEEAARALSGNASCLQRICGLLHYTHRFELCVSICWYSLDQTRPLEMWIDSAWGDGVKRSCSRSRSAERHVRASTELSWKNSVTVEFKVHCNRHTNLMPNKAVC